MQVNGRRSRAFAIERSIRQGCPLSPLLYVLALEPLRGVPFAGPLTARVSVFADDITVFVSQGPSVGVMDPSASSGRGSVPTSNRSEIGRS